MRLHVNGGARRSGRRAGIAALITAMAFGSSVAAASAPASAAVGTSTLAEGESLSASGADQFLVSPSGQHRLQFRTVSGSLPLVQYFGSTPVFTIGGIAGGDTGARLRVQSDGNVVLYSGAGAPVFATGTSSTQPVRLVLQDDANLVLYRQDGGVLWASGAKPYQMLYTNSGGFTTGRTVLKPDYYLVARSGRGQLLLQADGNLVQYAATGAPGFATRTSGPNARFLVQSDGNMVVYIRGIAAWQSGTGRAPIAGNPANYALVLQDDGNLVLYRSYPRTAPGPVAIWASSRGRIG